MAQILRNPIPTAGDVRVARSRSEPALRYLRWVAYFGLGLGLAGLSLRSRRGPVRGENEPGDGQHDAWPTFAVRMVEQGETAIGGLRSRPGVSRVASEAGKVWDDVTSTVEMTVDEAHDSLEEIYGRSYAWLGGLRRRLPRGGSRD